MGNGQQHLLDTTNDVERIFTDGNLILVIQLGGSLVTVDKTTNAILAEGSWDSLQGMVGFSIDPERNRLYARTGSGSPRDILFLSYADDDGTIIDSNDSPYHGVYPVADNTFCIRQWRTSCG